MGFVTKFAGIGAALVALAGCAEPTLEVMNTFPKGEQLGVRQILAENQGKRACVDYRASDNSCASIITSRLRGNTMISRELGALAIPGSTSIQRVEVVTRSTLRGQQACARAADISVTGRDTASNFVQGLTRQLVNDFGGTVCGSYFRDGQGYIVRSVGANGDVFPPGDTRFRYLGGDLKLRAQ